MDATFPLELHEFDSLVREVRFAWQSTGRVQDGPTPSQGKSLFYQENVFMTSAESNETDRIDARVLLDEMIPDDIVFIYYPVPTNVELSVKGTPKGQKEVFIIFNRVVLDDNSSVPPSFNVQQDKMKMKFLDKGEKGSGPIRLSYSDKWQIKISPPN